MQTGIAFPEALESLLVLRALGEKAAAKASRGYLSGAELADVTKAMLELSDRFNGIDASPLSDYMQSRWHRAAYYLYFLPANFAKAWAVLSELAACVPGRDNLSILDVGSGPGSLSLGALDYFVRRHGVKRLSITALDSSRLALEDLRSLVRGHAESLAAEGFAADVSVETRTVDVAAATPPAGAWDIILFGDSLNELWRGAGDAVGERARLLASYSSNLAADGSTVVIEPALKEVSRALQAVRDGLVARHGLRIYAPCLRQNECPMLSQRQERDWCHTAALWMRPRIVRRIDQATGRNKHVVKFSYLVARKAPGYPVEPPGEGWFFRVVGDRITEKGKAHMLLCGERGCVTATLLTRDETESNAAFTRLYRGDVVAIDSLEERKDGLRVRGDSSVHLLRRFSTERREE